MTPCGWPVLQSSSPEPRQSRREGQPVHNDKRGSSMRAENLGFTHRILLMKQEANCFLSTALWLCHRRSPSGCSFTQACGPQAATVVLVRPEHCRVTATA